MFIFVINIYFLFNLLGSSYSVASKTEIQEDTIPIFNRIKGGSFLMGSNNGDNDEKPVHVVYLTNFYISKYEITNAQFCVFLNDYKSNVVKSGENKGQVLISESSGIYDFGVHFINNIWQPAKSCENYPVVNVSWYGAEEYCKWLSDKLHKKCDLPTEAQWEYVAKGGSFFDVPEQRWSGTDDENEITIFAWINKNSYKRTHLVGKKKPSKLDVYDMTGNALEWCKDWYDSTYYSRSPVVNPCNENVGESKILRGGRFLSINYKCRNSYRNYYAQTLLRSDIGFRVVINE